MAAAAALVDIRETLHSSRLLDAANRLNPVAHEVVRRLGLLLHAKGLSTNVAQSGSYQLFRLLVVNQTDLLAFIDVFWSLALLALTGIGLVLVFSRGGTGKTAPVPSVYQHS